MRKARKGGKPSIVCSVRIRKGCRRAYQEAYRALKAPTLMRAIMGREPHPSRPGFVLVRLSCGHAKDLRTGDVNSGRKTTKCRICAGVRKGGEAVTYFESPPRWPHPAAKPPRASTHVRRPVKP